MKRCYYLRKSLNDVDVMEDTSKIIPFIYVRIPQCSLQAVLPGAADPSLPPPPNLPQTRRHATVQRNLAAITGRPGGADPSSSSGDSLLRRSPWTAGDDGRGGCAAFLGLLPVRDDGQELLVDTEGRPGGEGGGEETPEQQPPTVTVPGEGRWGAGGSVYVCACVLGW